MSPTHQQLLFAAEVLFLDLSANTSANILIGHFSSTKEVVIQHAPALCPHPHTSRVTGLNAVRSYFDLIATHWFRSDTEIHGQTVVDSRHVAVTASVRWTWRLSGRSWVEDFVCTLDYDEHLKIVGMVVETQSAPGTCIMRAVDADPTESGDLPTAPGVRPLNSIFLVDIQLISFPSETLIGICNYYGQLGMLQQLCTRSLGKDIHLHVHALQNESFEASFLF